MSGNLKAKRAVRGGVVLKGVFALESVQKGRLSSTRELNVDDGTLKRQISLKGSGRKYHNLMDFTLLLTRAGVKLDGLVLGHDLIENLVTRRRGILAARLFGIGATSFD